MKRKTYLSLCRGDPDRMDGVTSQAIKNYFDLLEKTLKDNNLLLKSTMSMKLGWLANTKR